MKLKVRVFVWIIGCVIFFITFTKVARVGVVTNKQGSDEFVSDLDLVHQARREHVQRVCQQRPSEFKVWADLSRYFSFSDRHRLVYCSVQKVGCSFWLQVMKILTGQLPQGSLYQGSFYHTVGMRGHYSFRGKPPSEKRRLLDTYKKFMFVRDPYARLFSAYMDKVFNPTRQMRMILRHSETFRTHDTRAIARELECATNVSFRNFVQTLLSSKGKWFDPHFTHMFRHCDPCSVHFDYIGKMETFVVDAKYILDKAGVDGKLLTASEELFRSGNEILAIRDFANGILFFRRSKNCKPTYLCEIYLRIWVTLQTRGLISTEVLYPFPLDNCSSAYVSYPIEELVKAHMMSGNRSVRMRQRQAAMMEAYYSIPRSLLKELQKFAQDDCDLFGYECSVDVRFPEDRYTPSNYSFFRQFW
ncbi:hypothetical protein BaRGS_00002664 [Batillaria attramentaria]|uniref:Carbohydrate sulfotransferase n=1 Tax=Batillaria attramentaria TaxID=370345 RepID=A0ABD0M2V0_9CAEN